MGSLKEVIDLLIIKDWARVFKITANASEIAHFTADNVPTNESLWKNYTVKSFVVRLKDKYAIISAEQI